MTSNRRLEQASAKRMLFIKTHSPRCTGKVLEGNTSGILEAAYPDPSSEVEVAYLEVVDGEVEAEQIDWV